MIKKILVAAALLFGALAPAAAQFADQATYAGTGAGTANAQTISLGPNVTSYADLVGVLIKYVPAATNTGDATLTVNGFGTSPHFRKPTGSGMSLLTGTSEVVTGQPTYVMYDGTYFNLVAPVGLPVGAAGLQNSALSFGVPVNLQLNATVSTNNLTISVSGLNGSAPSATNPVLIPFRHSTIANGSPQIVSLQSALSFQINSGSTMGCTSGQMCRLWIEAICATGLECTGSAGSDVVALCAFNAMSGGNIAPINEAALQTSASGTNGGSSAQTYYCNSSAVTARAIRILGYIDIQESTAGAWASGPTYVQLFGPGIKKPGDVVQTVTFSTTTTTSVSTVTATATTLLKSITPTSAANIMQIMALGAMQNTSGGNASGMTQLYRGTVASPIGNLSLITAGSGAQNAVGTANYAMDAPNTTSPTTYGLYIESLNSSGGTYNFLPTQLGVPPNTGIITINEIMGSLDPVNDNDPRLLQMVG